MSSTLQWPKCRIATELKCETRSVCDGPRTPDKRTRGATAGATERVVRMSSEDGKMRHDRRLCVLIQAIVLPLWLNLVF